MRLAADSRRFNLRHRHAGPECPLVARSGHPPMGCDPRARRTWTGSLGGDRRGSPDAFSEGRNRINRYERAFKQGRTWERVNLRPNIAIRQQKSKQFGRVGWY
jgi:hypothetical protein